MQSAMQLPDPEHVRELFASRAKPADPDDLAAYAHGILSQSGEDGIVNEILTRAGFPTHRSVEIGCGANGGNSGLLAACFGYRSLMVDGNSEMLGILRRLFAERSVRAVQSWVTAENIDDLIGANDFAGEVDHFGLDLDGIDYWVWGAMTACDPLLVVAEYNPLLGPTVAATIAYDPAFARHASMSAGPRWPDGYWGVSLAGLVALGRRRGYRLVATSPEYTSNAFFIKDQACPSLRTLSPDDAWRPPRAKGRSRPLYAQIHRPGVLRYFEEAGCPLVQVDESGTIGPTNL